MLHCFLGMSLVTSLVHKLEFATRAKARQMQLDFEDKAEELNNQIQKQNSVTRKWVDAAGTGISSATSS